MARPKSTTKDSTANLGFEATAMRGRAISQRAAILWSLEGNRWLTADSRGEAETAEGNLRNNLNAADWSGSTKTARTGSPEGACGGQPSRARQPERSGDCPAALHLNKLGQTANGSPLCQRRGVHQFGVPPKGNANFARMQDFIYHLSPQGISTARTQLDWLLAELRDSELHK